MIIIATHKDFNYDGRFKNACIIDGNECRKTYDIPVYHENEKPTFYTGFHESYAELTRLYWFFANFGSKELKDVCGLQQYKRMLKVNEEDIPNILERHGVILPKPIKQCPSVKKAYWNYHRKEDIEWCYDNIPKIWTEYKKETESVLDGELLHPHNIFITKKQTFINYFNWLWRIFDEFNKAHHWKCWRDMNAEGMQNKTHGFLAERVSNIFWKHHFPNPYIA